jgi:hypothetical protein
MTVARILVLTSVVAAAGALAAGDEDGFLGTFPRFDAIQPDVHNAISAINVAVPEADLPPPS